MRRGILGLIFSAVLALPLAANAAFWTFGGGLNTNQENTHPLTLPTNYFGGGLLTATLDDVTGAYALNVMFGGLTGDAAAAHIHFGAPGVAGPIIVDLGSPATFFPGLGVYSFTTTLAAAEVAMFTSNGTLGVGDASDFYVNIHTAANPLGEIRGQLVVTTSPAPVPVPAAIWLLGSALVGGLTLRRRA